MTDMENVEKNLEHYSEIISEWNLTETLKSKIFEIITDAIRNNDDFDPMWDEFDEKIDDLFAPGKSPIPEDVKKAIDDNVTYGVFHILENRYKNGSYRYGVENLEELCDVIHTAIRDDAFLVFLFTAMDSGITPSTSAKQHAKSFADPREFS